MSKDSIREENGDHNEIRQTNQDADGVVSNLGIQVPPNTDMASMIPEDLARPVQKTKSVLKKTKSKRDNKEKRKDIIL